MRTRAILLATAALAAGVFAGATAPPAQASCSGTVIWVVTDGLLDDPPTGALPRCVESIPCWAAAQSPVLRKYLDQIHCVMTASRST